MTRSKILSVRGLHLRLLLGSYAACGTCIDLAHDGDFFDDLYM